MSHLKAALEVANIRITGYDPTKARPVFTVTGKMDIKKFITLLTDRLGNNLVDHPEVFKATYDHNKMSDMIEAYSSSEGILESEKEEDEIVVPEELKPYTLNVNKAAKRGEEEFFLTTKDEFVSRTTGKYYISKCKIPPPIIYDWARPVIPEYKPRSKPGIIEIKNTKTKEVENILNTYIPPEWMQWRKEHYNEWEKLSGKPPVLFMKMLKHLFPRAEDRRYFYAWLYASMFTRSYVYLVLQGAPGAGKNRLKLVLRALHGDENTVDGKKSSLTERFNSQLSHGTLAWFDELKYDSDMENVMKEIQNDYLSIERKGVDATRSSIIYTSMVISNNKPRDNYIAFDARKFAPLEISTSNLNDTMTFDEIEELTQKVESGKEGFDVKYVAQIAKWIMRVGKRNMETWPVLEYKSPYFWVLAHTSMTRWQKKAITALVDKKSGTRIGWDEEAEAHIWSKVEEKITKRSNDNTSTFPDYSSVRAFFDVFRDGNGEKAFETEPVPGQNIMGDFYIKPLTEDLEIITEATAALKKNKKREMTDEEKERYADI